MEKSFFDEFIKKKITKEKVSDIPCSIDEKLNQAYELIRQDSKNLTVSKAHKNLLRRNIAIAASLILVISVVIKSTPTLADKIPTLNQLSDSLKEICSFDDSYISAADKMNITRKDNGVDVNLQGVIYDEASLKLIYTISSEKNLQGGVQMGDNSLKINGKNILINSSNIIVSNDRTKISGENDKLHQFALITTFDVSNLKLASKAKIQWTLNGINLIENNDYVKGKWQFNFKTSSKAIKGKSKIVNTNYTKEKNGYKCTLNKIIFTPTEIKMISTEDKKLNEEIYAAACEYEKDKGNKEAKEKLNTLERVQNELYFTGMNMSIRDENGNELSLAHQNSSNGTTVSSYKALEKLPQKLIFTPVDHVTEEDVMKLPDKDQFVSLRDIKTPFEYIEGENMIIVINSIDNKDGRTRINVTLKGGIIGSRAVRPFEVIPHGLKYPTSPDKKDKFYNIVDSMRKTDSSKYWKKAIDNINTFDYEFELKDNENYDLVFDKFKIPYMKDKQIVIKMK